MKELDLAIIQFMKTCTSGVDEMLDLLAAEYHLRFGRPLLLDSALRAQAGMPLIWALKLALREGNPNYQAYLRRDADNQALG